MEIWSLTSVRQQNPSLGLAPAVIAPPELQMDLVNFYKEETTSYFRRNRRGTAGSRPNTRKESSVHGFDEPIPAETEANANTFWFFNS